LLERQIPEAELASIDAAILAEVEEAAAFALESPYAEVDEIRIDVLAQEIAA
jgi:TPP-dependent pyruvate/acetoin dehydrogenase alpha subunit